MNPQRHEASGVKRAQTDSNAPGRFVMEVTWRDGRVSRYPWGYVRTICPCANCRGQIIARVTAEGGPIPDTPVTRIVNLQHVGHYALGISFEDAHQTILPWDYLRELDPDESDLAARVEYLRKDKRLL
ncbi:MAG: DUF971 domain-containing protein [Planctomycetes bacterium]|nr:DUF971 domain-containing protein [Planctomycetota bacterium]